MRQAADTLPCFLGNRLLPALGGLLSHTHEVRPPDHCNEARQAFQFGRTNDLFRRWPNAHSRGPYSPWIWQSPQQNIAKLPFQVNGGLTYRELTPRLDDGEGHPDCDLVFEWNYKIQMTKFAFVQPDILWVINPGGTNRIPDTPCAGRPDGRGILGLLRSILRHQDNG